MANTLFTLTRGRVLPEGAYGIISLTGRPPFAVTLERTYEQPAEPVVKIPPGVHRCVRSLFNRGGYWTYEIQILGHTLIKFHKANTADDLDGCVGLGEQFGSLHGVPGILQSGAAFDEFMRLADNRPEFLLEVE